MAQYHLDRVPELVDYLHLILDAHQQSRTESMLNYDSFRGYIAENPHARWDQVNTRLCLPVVPTVHRKARKGLVHDALNFLALKPFVQAWCPKQGGMEFASTSTDVRALRYINFRLGHAGRVACRKLTCRYAAHSFLSFHEEDDKEVLLQV